MIDFVQKTITFRSWIFYLAALRRIASEVATRAHRATARNLSGIAKHRSIPFLKAYISDKVLGCFSEVARISFSPTFVDTKSYF